MSSKERSLIVAATFGIYVLAHLVTLMRTPLAWRNEDFFATRAVIVMGLILVLRLYRECRRPAASSADFPLGESW